MKSRFTTSEDPRPNTLSYKVMKGLREGLNHQSIAALIDRPVESVRQLEYQLRRRGVPLGRNAREYSFVVKVRLYEYQKLIDLAVQREVEPRELGSKLLQVILRDNMVEAVLDE